MGKGLPEGGGVRHDADSLLSGYFREIFGYQSLQGLVESSAHTMSRMMVAWLCVL